MTLREDKKSVGGGICSLDEAQEPASEQSFSICSGSFRVPASDESVIQEPQAITGTGTSSLDLWGLLQTSNSHMCSRSASPLSPAVLLPSSALYLRTSLRGSGV